MTSTSGLKTWWRGNFVAAVTPFDTAENVDERRFIANLELLLGEGADGFVVAGCTGEGWAIRPDERIRLFELALSTVAGQVPVIAGLSGIVTGDVVELGQRAKRAGVQGILVLPPYFALPGAREIVAYFQAISDGAQLPIMIYNNPRRTGINLQPALLAELAAIENVVAVKESSADFVQTERTIQELGDRLAVFTGHSAERGAAAVLMGAAGLVSSVETQTMGRRAMLLYESAASGDYAEARAIQLETLAVQHAVHSCGCTSPADLKAAMNMLGRPGGSPRSPILPVSEEQNAKLARNLRRLGLLNGR